VQIRLRGGKVAVTRRESMFLGLVSVVSGALGFRERQDNTKKGDTTSVTRRELMFGNSSRYILRKEHDGLHFVEWKDIREGDDLLVVARKSGRVQSIQEWKVVIVDKSFDSANVIEIEDGITIINCIKKT